jgi:hypothetical protein
MSKDINLNLNGLPAQLGKSFKKLSGYRVFIFFLVAASIYSYILWRINSFSDVAPSASDETAQSTAQPRIDPDTLEKIQNLQDNSVSVQTLFDNARQNPFQE